MIKLSYKPGNPAEDKLMDELVAVAMRHATGISTLWRDDDEIVEISLLD